MAQPRELPKPLSGERRWIVPGRTKQVLTIASVPEWWISHWDVGAGQSRRCAGPHCLLCSRGYPQVLRFVFAVVNGQGKHRYLELRERHRDDVQRINQRGSVGAVVRVDKPGQATNSPVRIRVLEGMVPMTEIDISALVLKLGLPPLLVGMAADVRQFESEAPETERVVRPLPDPIERAPVGEIERAMANARELVDDGDDDELSESYPDESPDGRVSLN